MRIHASVPKLYLTDDDDATIRIEYITQVKTSSRRIHSVPFEVAEKRNKNEFDTKINIFIVRMVITTIIVSGTIYQPIKPTKKYENIVVAFEPSRFIVVFISL